MPISLGVTVGSDEVVKEVVNGVLMVLLLKGTIKEVSRFVGLRGMV